MELVQLKLCNEKFCDFFNYCKTEMKIVNINIEVYPREDAGGLRRKYVLRIPSMSVQAT